MNETKHPLSWPIGKPWTEHRARSAYLVKGFAKIRKALLRELRLLKATNVVLSTNVEIRQDGLPYANRRQPDNPGVAVYFLLNETPLVFALDRWKHIEHNMHGIALHIGALRAVERTGVASLEEIFAGHKALPEVASATAFLIWHDVLEVSPDCTFDQAKAAFRRKVKITHPDHGGDPVDHHRVITAWRTASQVLGQTLPG